MNDISPINQLSLFGLDNYFLNLIKLENKNIFPNKILFSGQKGLGKSTLAYHFINYSLSKNEEFSYDLKNFKINPESSTFKTIQNQTNTNFILIDIFEEKKIIDINQIRNLISILNKSSFNNKPRYVLIDNIEFLGVNSINSLLKILEEPSTNIFFILINNNKRVLPTLLSRCINFKISLSYENSLNVSSKILNEEIENFINPELINYYFTPGTIYNLIKLGKEYKIDLLNINLNDFLSLLIKNNLYKKNELIKNLIFNLIEFYFRQINLSLTTKIYDKYSQYIKKISNTKRFNLDEEILFTQFEEEILNG